MNGFVRPGGLALSKITPCMWRRMCYPLKWPYLDTQEVLTVLYSGNENTEKDEIIK